MVQAALDKARPNLPVQPLPPSKGKKEDARGVKSAGAQKKEAEKKGAAVKGKVSIWIGLIRKLGFLNNSKKVSQFS